MAHRLNERPIAANLCQEVGHGKADTIIGKLNHSCLVTLIDRKTRYLLAGKAVRKDAQSVNQTILDLVQSLSASCLRTITPDRGSEFAKTARITDQRSVEFYFPTARAPWH